MTVLGASEVDAEKLYWENLTTSWSIHLTQHPFHQPSEADPAIHSFLHNGSLQTRSTHLNPPQDPHAPRSALSYLFLLLLLFPLPPSTPILALKPPESNQLLQKNRLHAIRPPLPRQNPRSRKSPHQSSPKLLPNPLLPHGSCPPLPLRHPRLRRLLHQHHHRQPPRTRTRTRTRLRLVAPQRPPRPPKQQ